jgi:hypothetical protein
MTTPDPAANNTELWTTYLRGQMRALIDPMGLARPEAVDIVARPLADMAAAAMSGWISLFASAPVDTLFKANKTQVTEFVQQQAIDADGIEIPPQYASQRRYPAPTQLEDWGITAIRGAAREAVLST